MKNYHRAKGPTFDLVTPSHMHMGFIRMTVVHLIQQWLPMNGKSKTLVVTQSTGLDVSAGSCMC